MPAASKPALSVTFLGKRLSGPFTIPSGIVATAVPIIEYLFEHVPQIGVMTTKSIGPEPRAGYREPVYSQYAPGCFVNAVGLTNPGAKAALAGLEELDLPDDRFHAARHHRELDGVERRVLLGGHVHPLSWS